MTPELELLKPALEMAMIVARAGERAPVRIEAPRPLRPFLRFTKLPPRALVAARAALEDDAFRARVAQRSDEEEVGRAGWLFLTRPEGWADEFGALLQQADADAAAAADDDVRGELDRAAATIREQQAELDDQARDLHRLRQQLDHADRRRDEHRADLADAEGRAAAALDDRAEAVRQLKDMERRLAERTAELRDVAAARSVPDEPGHDRRTDDARWTEAEQLLLDLRQGWEAMGDALDRVERLVAGGDAETAGNDPRALPHRRGRRRRPLRLGQGLTEATPDAARWLLARPGAVAVVDGYNVTMLAWPDLSVTEQRAALERAAAQVQVQFGCDVVLVFDGDDEGGSAVRSAVGSPVRVRFTHRDVEADDEILEMVEVLAAPVVIVVSNDRRVLDGARERGANTVRTTDFVALLR